VDDPTDDTPEDEALTECEQKVEELKEENAQLRNAAETFGDLAERLNTSHRTSTNAQEQPKRAKGGKSQPDKGLSN
jgi:predicted RNase H-like nuclease (RuvC/YqgF family)